MNNKHFVSAFAWLLVCTALATAPKAQGQSANYGVRSAGAAQTSRELKIKGLRQPVEVARDRWGIAHIYAGNTEDLFFAQGYVTAQDRLWQMEIWRRSAIGELAEILGERALERDRLARLMRYRGSMEAEWKSYAPDAKMIIESFVRGINAYIQSTGDDLPPEFKIAGVKPQMWTPEVCLNRISGLEVSGNAAEEIVRARLVKAAGAEKASELMATDPFVRMQIPEGLDLDDITPAITRLINASAPISYANLTGTPETAGSNNWAVSGKLSATGKPLLAGDPHRRIAVPSLRYIVHLNAPGWNVIGAGEPALPGVAIGHNEHIGFAFTITGIDEQDVYVEETDAKDSTKYLFQDRWETMRVETERIKVKGKAEPVSVDLRFTRHGPVIYEDKTRNRAYALRSISQEPGTAPYLASLSVNRATDWKTFLSALSRWKSPGESFVYADVKGNIGWKVAGFPPVRNGWSGLLPVPGKSGKYEWQGFLEAEKLPGAYNPPSQFANTSNNNILPPGYKYEIGYDFAAPFRARRVRQVLETGRRFTVADFERLQHDELSLIAQEVVPLLKNVDAVKSADLREAIELLLGWNFQMDKDSAAAALYAVWYSRIPTNTYKPVLPEEIWRIANSQTSTVRTIEILKTADPKHFGENAKNKRDEVLLASLREALPIVRQRLGDDMKKWRWGAMHMANLTHPLAVPANPNGKIFQLPAVERGGDGNTVNATSGANFQQTSGASYRQVLDLSDWDNSTATSVPGQSGNPNSKFYSNLLPLWAEGKYFPLLFTKKKIMGNLEEKIQMTPLVEKSK